MHLAIQLVSAADPFYLVNTLIMGGCFYVCISPLFVLIFRSILVLPQRLIPTHTQINKLPLLNCSIDWSCSEVFLAEDLRPLCQSSRQAVNRQWLLMSPPVGKNPHFNEDQTHAPGCVNPTPPAHHSDPSKGCYNKGHALGQATYEGRLRHGEMIVVISTWLLRER